MKRLFLIIFLLSFVQFGNTQSNTSSTLLTDSISANIADLLNDVANLQKKQIMAERYKIYPTENMYISLKLDKQTGRIDLIQWSIKPDNEFSKTLNDSDLSCFSGLNSFELYPTQNMYQFILLDKATGNIWHVQWGTKSSEQWIRPIR